MTSPGQAIRPGPLADQRNDQIIYLVRHGETEWNVARRRQGQRDSPLTDRGNTQARQIGAWFRDTDVDFSNAAIHASPLGRTRQTLHHICNVAGLDQESTQFDPRLKEISFGHVEGLTNSEIREAHPPLLTDHESDRWNHVYPGGESLAKVADRVRAWHAGLSGIETLIVVSHGGIGRVIRGLYRDLTLDEISLLEEPQDAVIRLSDGVETRFQA